MDFTFAWSAGAFHTRPIMMQWLTVLSTWLMLSCFTSGSALHLSELGQTLVAQSPLPAPADASPAALAGQASELEDRGVFQATGAKAWLPAAFAALAFRPGFAELAWQQGWLEGPKHRAMLGVAPARAPPARRG